MAYPIVHKFNDMVAQDCAKLSLYDKAQCLATKYQFSEQDHTMLEQKDQQLTKILTRTDQKLAHYHKSPWLLAALHQAFLSHWFWTVSLTHARTHQDYSTMLQIIEAQMKTPPEITGLLMVNLKRAQQQIREIKRKVDQCRNAYLQELLDAVQQTNDKGWQQLIRHLCMAEQNRKCFQLHRQLMNLILQGASHDCWYPMKQITTNGRLS